MIRFNSPAINCFDACDNSIDENLTIYHYTSAEAFYSIINNQSLRFSDLKYMNDKSEKIFFIKRLIDFYFKRKADYPDFCHVVDLLLKGNDYELLKNASMPDIKFNTINHYPYKPFRTFVFCSCREPDLLNMWNYYVYNSQYIGYNIGVSAYKLLKMFDSKNYLQHDNFLLYYGNIVYDTAKQYKHIEGIAETMEKSIRTLGKKQSAYNNAALDLRAFIDTKGAFFKSDKFSHEKEFRIVFGIQNDKSNCFETFNSADNKRIEKEFYVKNGLITPCLRVTLPLDSIRRITMSPMTEYEIAKESIKELLETKGYRQSGKSTSIPIYKSRIPIRF